jgi:DNA mismatch repair protein MutH
MSNIEQSRIFTRKQVDALLTAIIGKSLLQVDKARLFIRHEGRDKVKGIVGDIIEESVLGCKKDSKQEPDILVDNVLTEIKTTGLVKPKKKDSPYVYECKEPVSITAVSIPVIVNEEFETSNFWHKLAHMLWVYYWYKSPITVKLEGYKDFPVLGYQFYVFSEDDRALLRQDWLLVRDFLIVIHRDYHTQKEREEQYPRLSHELRGQLMLIDTAPKFPNNPRFRLKRAYATVIADHYFSKKHLEKLDESISKYTDIDRKCQLMTQKYRGKSFAQIALELGVNLNMDVKNFAESAVVKMFGGHVSKLNDIEDFAKIGIIAKSVPLKENGMGKEDMKLFLPNLIEWTRESEFEESAIYDYFAGHHFLFIIYKHVGKDVVFEGFKRIFFDEKFISENVKKTWDDVRDLIINHKLRIEMKIDKNGNYILNKSGSFMESPNFPKKSTHKVFLRGGAATSEEKNKTLEINGLKMIPQSIWLSRDEVKKLIENE